MVTDDFEHQDRADRDSGGYTYSHPTDGSTIARFLSGDHESDQDRRLQYQECITREQARIAREGSFLQPEDLCNIYPGR